jgi:hypothetical protein
MQLKDAIATLESGAWCSLRVFTANVAKGTGGKIIELAKCRIFRNKPVDHPSSNATAITGKTKAQNHHLHFTRNVQLQNHQIIKVHPILITHINNLPVL